MFLEQLILQHKARGARPRPQLAGELQRYRYDPSTPGCFVIGMLKLPFFFLVDLPNPKFDHKGRLVTSGQKALRFGGAGA